MNIKSNKLPVNKASPAPVDRLDISGRSKKIADITAALDRFPETRDDRAQEIKQRLDAGTYSVDPRKVAESILKSLCPKPRA